jgi:hypothetical protein
MSKTKQEFQVTPSCQLVPEMQWLPRGPSSVMAASSPWGFPSLLNPSPGLVLFSLQFITKMLANNNF